MQPLILPHWLVLPKKETQDTIYIYCLIDPFSEKVRYIGKSIKPRTRLVCHMSDRSDCHRARWLQSLNRKATRPMIGILDSCASNDDWKSLEKQWIKQGKELGWPLTNATEGGDGVCGVSPEVRAKIVAFHRGRKRSEETRQRISDACKGMQRRLGAKLSDETKHKISIASSQHKHSQEQKDKVGAFFRGVPKTPEQKAKMSLARKQWWERKKSNRSVESPDRPDDQPTKDDQS